MIGTKPWYLSRTIWAALVTIAMSLASLLGIGDAGIDHGAVTDLLLQTITGIMGVATILGRLGATRKIG